MKCVVNWIALKIYVRSRNTQPHEGTGTWPDYLVNGDDKKKLGVIRGIFFTEIEKEQTVGEWEHTR